jgi:U2 small nuclear ribonucleoprotein B''
MSKVTVSHAEEDNERKRNRDAEMEDAGGSGKKRKGDDDDEDMEMDEEDNVPAAGESECPAVPHGRVDRNILAAKAPLPPAQPAGYISATLRCENLPQEVTDDVLAVLFQQ